MASADVLEDVDVAALREVDGRVVGGGEALGAVGRARDEDRMTPVADRPIDVGVERDAVAHADGHAVVDDGCRCGRRRRPGSAPAPVLHRRQRRPRDSSRISSSGSTARRARRSRRIGVRLPIRPSVSSTWRRRLATILSSPGRIIQTPMTSAWPFRADGDRRLAVPHGLDHGRRRRPRRRRPRRCGRGARGWRPRARRPRP